MYRGINGLTNYAPIADWGYWRATANVPSLLILYDNLPLLGKDGSWTTNSPPLLRRGQGW